MLKVKFKNPFYGPLPTNPDTSFLFQAESDLPEGADGVFEFPDDYPLPSDAIIVEGTSTYVKPGDQSPEPVTQIQPAAMTKAGKKLRTASQ